MMCSVKAKETIQIKRRTIIKNHMTKKIVPMLIYSKKVKKMIQ